MSPSAAVTLIHIALIEKFLSAEKFAILQFYVLQSVFIVFYGYFC